MTTYAVVGRPVTRQEGPDKVSGTFLYSADVALPGMLWGKVLRSPFPQSRLVHEGSPICASASGPIQPHGNILNHATWSAGDLAQGFRESDLIFEHTFTTTWGHQGYMEPYACVVALDAAGRMQVWANNKVPYTLRKQLADALGFSEDQIVVNPCGIGGDFGGKSPAMNVPLAYSLSLRSGRPVKMLMSYTEELMAGNPRHPAVVTIKTGVK